MGSLFGKAKAPKVEVNAPSPQLEPTPDPEEPKIGYQETEEQKAKKGKKGLKITRIANNSVNYAG